MHARVAVASNSLAGNDLPLVAANAIHRSLTTDLNAYGRLVFTSEREIGALVRAIKTGPGLSPDTRKHWTETMVALRRHGRIHVIDPPSEVGLADAHTLEEVRAKWGASTDVAVIAEVACEPLGVPVQVGMLADPSTAPELVTAAAATAGPTLRRIKDAAEHGTTPFGVERERFWSEVLGPVASNASIATVLDAYLFGALWDIAERRPKARKWRREHVRWLLEHLDNVMAPGAEVHLIAKADPKRPGFTASTTAKTLARYWNPAHDGHLGQVTVTLASPGNGKFPHDRHIRFNNGAAFRINAGFDRLREETIWDADGMGWQFRWHPKALEDLRSAEERGKSYADDLTATVLERVR